MPNPHMRMLVLCLACKSTCHNGKWTVATQSRWMLEVRVATSSQCP